MVPIDENFKDIVTDISRDQVVVKSNSLIQHARFNLSLVEQRIIVFLISKIKSGDTGLDAYPFSFREFLDLCGLEREGGMSYEYLRDTLKRLSDKSIWVDAEWDRNGKHHVGQTLVRWLNDIEVSETSSMVWIEFHKKMLPYLFHLRERFTQYQLRNILAMNSTYAAALYEILKSYEYLDRPVGFELDELKFMLGADDIPSYEMYKCFKQKVLEKAVSEINTYSDLSVSYETKKTGRKVSRIVFTYNRKSDAEQSKVRRNQDIRFHPGQLPGQISMSEL